jgi:hypothetical protein
MHPQLYRECRVGRFDVDLGRVKVSQIVEDCIVISGTWCAVLILGNHSPKTIGVDLFLEHDKVSGSFIVERI